MKNVDFIKIILITYGYFKNIEVSENNKTYDFITYDIFAYNPITEDQIKIHGDSFSQAIQLLLKYFYSINAEPYSVWSDNPTIELKK